MHIKNWFKLETSWVLFYSTSQRALNCSLYAYLSQNKEKSGLAACKYECQDLVELVLGSQ